MSRQSHPDVTSRKESDVASLIQSELYKSVDGNPEFQNEDKKTKRENYYSNSFEKGRKYLFDGSTNRTKNFFKIVA